MSSNDSKPAPPAEPSLTRLLEEIRDEIRALRADFAQVLALLPTARPADASHRPKEETLNDSTESLRHRLEVKMDQADPYGLLDVRQALVGRLNADEILELDRRLAQWFGPFFQKALRSGQAIIVAGAMERAIEELSPLPELEPLADALPLVRRTIGVWQDVRQAEADEWD